MGDTIYMVPSIHEKGNPWLFCNFARMHNREEKCLECTKTDCQHHGKHTIINRGKGEEG